MSDSTGGIFQDYIYVYDANGNQIEKLAHSEGEVYDRKTYQYDENGHQTDEFWHNDDGTIRFHQQFESNELGHKTVTYMYRRDNLYRIKRCVYQYNQYSDWTKQTCIFFRKSQNSWNVSNGNLITRVLEY